VTKVNDSLFLYNKTQVRYRNGGNRTRKFALGKKYRNNDELEKLNPISLAGERSGEKKPRVLLKYGMATEFRERHSFKETREIAN